MSSCCGGNCGCGPSCKCGSGCGGCKMNPDMPEEKSTTGQTSVLGMAPEKEGVVQGISGGERPENTGCKCNPCTCNPCTCK